MAADLHIHVLTEECTEEHVKADMSNVMGSKYENPDLDFKEKFEKAHKCRLVEVISNTPNIWVGEVSWLKAAFFNDSKTFIPDPIGNVYDVIGEDFPIIDDALIEKIKTAMKVPNQTDYTISSIKKVIGFLKAHKDKKAFTISW